MIRKLHFKAHANPEVRKDSKNYCIMPPQGLDLLLKEMSLPTEPHLKRKG